MQRVCVRPSNLGNPTQRHAPLRRAQRACLGGRQPGGGTHRHGWRAASCCVYILCSAEAQSEAAAGTTASTLAA